MTRSLPIEGKQMTVAERNSSRVAARAIVQTVPSLCRWLETNMSRDSDHELSIRQLSVLQQIAGEETTPGDIARSLNVTPAVVTGLIDRMERRGYVRRFESQFDRRRIHVELTVSGEDARNLAEENLLDDIENAITELSSEDQETLANAMHSLFTLAEKQSQKTGIAGA
jgi:DNA-binding MarR family transcriptional regulator